MHNFAKENADTTIFGFMEENEFHLICNAREKIQ